MTQNIKDSSSLSDRFDELAETFSRRLRIGNAPSIDEFINEFQDRMSGELESRIRHLFPILILMECDGSRPDDWSQVGSIEGTIENAIQNYQGPPAGRELGDFKIEEEIGRGGMGIVYVARQKSLNRKVALKLLPASSQFDHRRKTRFQHEARSAALLHHTNIVPIFHIGEHEGLCYFVMQHIEGHSLGDVLTSFSNTCATKDSTRLAADGSLSTISEKLFGTSESPAGISTSKNTDGTEENTNELMLVASNSATSNNSTLTAGRLKNRHIQMPSDYWNRVARIGDQIAQAVQHAHGKGILHRDIKPSNLLINEAQEVWVTDFGLAKSLNSPDLTRTGEIVGTLRYMSPEQMNGETDERSDIFSIGLTLYEMLTFQPAYDAEERQQLVQQIVSGNIPEVLSRNRHVPRDLATIVDKCIRPEPAHRYESANELCQDLRRFLAGQPIHARRIGIGEKFWKWCKRNPVVATLSSSLFLTLVAGILSTTYQWQITAAALKKSESQSELSLQTMFNVIDEFQGVLKSANKPSVRTVEARRNLVENVLDGLRHVSEDLRERDEYSKTLIWSHLDLGQIFVQIGQEGFQDARNLAMQEYEEAYRIAKGWLAEDPNDLDVKMIYAEVLARKGEIALFHYRFDEALEQFGNARQELMEVVEQDPDAYSCQRRIIFLSNSLGVAEFRRFQPELAVPYFRETIQAYNALKSEAPDEISEYLTSVVEHRCGDALLICENLRRVKADLSVAYEFEPRIVPRMLYDCAAWFAFEGDHENAFKALQEINKIDDLKGTDYYSNACGYGRCAKALLNGSELSGLTPVKSELFDTYLQNCIQNLEAAEKCSLFVDSTMLGLLGRDTDLKVFREHPVFLETFERIVSEHAD